jgi:thioredoxin 1
VKFTKKVWGVLATLTIFLIGGYYLYTHSYKTTSESDVIKRIATEQELKTVFENAGSKMLVFDLYAEWCSPCRVIRPILEVLASKYSGKVEFYSIDIDKSPEIASAFMANRIPYVVFFKDKKKVASLVGIKPMGSYEKVISTCTTSSFSCDSVLQTL